MTIVLDEIEKKYISEWEVLTPTGFKDFAGIQKIIKDEHYVLDISGNEFICSANHKIKTKDGFKYAKDLKQNEELLEGQTVDSITKVNEQIDLYDLMDVGEEREYYTDEIISHNCAFAEYSREIWTAAQQAAMSGKIIIVSTPNGIGNFYHQMWVDAEAGLNDFNTIKLKWDVHPEHDQAWRDEQTVLLGERLAGQECLDGDSTVTVKNIQTGIIQTIKLEDLDESINTKYEILTPSGFVKFSGINKLSKDEYIYFAFSNNTKLKCSKNHLFIRGGNQIKSEELSIGDYVDGKDGIITVTNRKVFKESISLYDIVGVDNGNIFYVNDSIVSHNCDADFITSGHTVIDGTILQWYKDNVEDPIEKRGLDGNIWIWERPDYHKSYVVCADVARGDGEDYSAFHILDIEDVRQVAEYKGKIPPAEFGNMLISMATEYNDALLIVDNTGLGWASIQPAIDRNYPFLFYMSKDFAYMDIQVQLQKGLDLKQKEDMVPGFTISVKTRPVIISKLETYFRERIPVIRSTRTIDELFVFIWNNGKAEARRGYNDDLTMALSIGFWVRDTALQLNQKGLALTKASMDYIGKLNEPQIYSTSPYTEAGKKAWTMNVGKNQVEDLEWLIR